MLGVSTGGHISELLSLRRDDTEVLLRVNYASVQEAVEEMWSVMNLTKLCCSVCVAYDSSSKYGTEGESNRNLKT